MFISSQPNEPCTKVGYLCNSSRKIIDTKTPIFSRISITPIQKSFTPSFSSGSMINTTSVSDERRISAYYL